MLRSFGWNDILLLLSATQWTLTLTVFAFAIGGSLGLAVAIMRVSRIRILRSLTAGFIYVIQGIPILMLLFVSYYGLALAGYSIPPFIAAVLALSVFAAAYLGDIWRGAIQAVPLQQWEASESLSLTRYQQYRHVILPQSVRLALPQTVGFLVQLVKNSSVGALIGFVELTRMGQLVSNATFDPLRTFFSVAVLYFVINYPLSVLGRMLERRTNVSR